MLTYLLKILYWTLNLDLLFDCLIWTQSVRGCVRCALVKFVLADDPASSGPVFSAVE